MPLLLDWRNTGQAEVLLPAADALRGGGIAVLPTESGYLLVGRADDDGAAGLLNSLKDKVGQSVALINPLKCLEEQIPIGRCPSPVKRLIARVWPGPVGITVADDQVRRVRWPAHAAYEALAAVCDFPLQAVEPAHTADSEETALTLADLAESVAIVVDAGPIRGRPLTWIAVDEAGYRVEQSGSVPEERLTAAAARWIVFVCTGNTCRSPMAEALCKMRLAQRFGCGLDELPARGYRIFSAGVAGYPGDAPSPDAVEVLRDLGADLSSHRSQPLSIEAVAHADYLIGMTRSHLLSVLTRYPVVGGALRLLCGADGDLDDPIGAGIEVYAACSRTILRHVDRLLSELVGQ